MKHAACFTLIALAAMPCLAEPHLQTVPRSASEAARVASVLAPVTDFTKPEPFEARPAGAATNMAAEGRAAFSAPSANMDERNRLGFAVGQSVFEKLWVTAPASTQSSDGLGPLYNARACSNCHVRGGRGHPPEADGAAELSVVLRLSVPGTAPKDEPNAPEPTYGRQIQTKSVPGIAAEGQLHLQYAPVPVELADGTIVTLRRPLPRATGLAHGPMLKGTRQSLRAAPQMIGLGLLEAIPRADILALADPEDADGDGISGRPNFVWSREYNQRMLGRFGHKAALPTVKAQTAAAFAGDIGLSSALHPAHWGDCTATQHACRTAPHGPTGTPEQVEVPDEVLTLVTYYASNLAVPARRNPGGPQVLRGKALFHASGCAACHQPKFVTHRLEDRTEQSFQLIWPYSDMLLHDMGDGLADGTREWLASGREWRTAPLWGIGMTHTVSGRQSFLHDGRARTLLEAILWHGGEAETARNAVRAMLASERDALIAFLESL